MKDDLDRGRPEKRRRTWILIAAVIVFWVVLCQVLLPTYPDSPIAKGWTRGRQWMIRTSSHSLLDFPIYTMVQYTSRMPFEEAKKLIETRLAGTGMKKVTDTNNLVEFTDGSVVISVDSARPVDRIGIADEDAKSTLTVGIGKPESPLWIVRFDLYRNLHPSEK